MLGMVVVLFDLLEKLQWGGEGVKSLLEISLGLPFSRGKVILETESFAYLFSFVCNLPEF